MNIGAIEDPSDAGFCRPKRRFGAAKGQEKSTRNPAKNRISPFAPPGKWWRTGAGRQSEQSYNAHFRMSTTEPSLAEIVAGTVEGAIVGFARALVEVGHGRKSGVLLESDGIVVERVNDHTSAYLEQALDLLDRESRISSDERRSREDLIRWARESNERTWQHHLRFRDHFFIARVEDRVDAMTFFTHYPLAGKTVISFLVARRQPKQYKNNINRSTIAIGKAMTLFHSAQWIKPRLVIAEVDDPRFTQSPPERNLRCARIRLYAQLANIYGTCLRVVDFPYLQPTHEPDGTWSTRPMLLVVFPLRDQPEWEELDRRHAGELLDFMYGRFYSDAFDGVPVKDALCRMSMAGIKADRIARLEQTIQCPLAELWLQRLPSHAQI